LAVTATANPQTNGWKTAVVTLNSGAAYVGDAGYERAFFRIRDVQPSNPVFDTDIDDDGLADGWELANLADGYDPLTPNNSYTDTDRDGLQLFEEIQLGTDPNVADAQPVYPSEDPDDYVPLTLALGAGGKLAELSPGSCATCHSAGLRAGAHTRSSPRSSWAFANNLQLHLMRFLRGSNYPVRLLDNPTAKVLSSSQTNLTTHRYTANYTAQFLTSAGNAYTLVTDTNQLFGTNRPMVLEALARNATLFVPDLLIAADVDRDGIVNTSNRVDRTSPNGPFTFWINDDADLGNDDAAEDLDPSTNQVNDANTTIDNLRDLEDFTRLHFRVEGLPGNLLTNAGLQTRIYLTNLLGTPSLRLFRATETNGGAAYLSDLTTANAQVVKPMLGVLTNGTPLNLAGTNWSAVTSNRFFLPFIFEGVSTGRCVIVLPSPATPGRTWRPRARSTWTFSASPPSTNTGRWATSRRWSGTKSIATPPALPTARSLPSRSTRRKWITSSLCMAGGCCLGNAGPSPARASNGSGNWATVAIRAVQLAHGLHGPEHLGSGQHQHAAKL